MSPNMIRDLSLRHIYPWDLFPQHDPSCLPTWSETCLCVIFIPGTCSRNMIPHVSQHDQRLVSASYLPLGLVPATWSLMSPNIIRDLSLRHINPWDLFPQHDPSCLPTWSETCLCVILIPGSSSRNMTPHPDQRLVFATQVSLEHVL